MRTARNNFTLLEVLTAMIVLTLGVSGLLWQFAIAADRSLRNAQRWERTHELTQAAEFLLLNGPEIPLDENFLSGDYRVSARLEDPQLPAGMEVQAGPLRLRTLVLTLSGEDGEEEEWKLDCWVRGDADVR